MAFHGPAKVTGSSIVHSSTSLSPSRRTRSLIARLLAQRHVALEERVGIADHDRVDHKRVAFPVADRIAGDGRPQIVHGRVIAPVGVDWRVSL